jgi:hypothetical protein
LIQFCETLQTSYLNKTNSSSSDMIKAIEAGRLLLKGGGKMIVFNSSKIMKGSNDLLSPLDNQRELYALGLGLTEDLISCDIIQSSKEHSNSLTLSEITNACNGNLHLIRNYNIDNHYMQLYNLILRILQRYTGWEALAKIKISKGFNLEEVITTVLRKDNVIILPTVDR